MTRPFSPPELGCYDCEHCLYLGDGAYSCDSHNFSVVMEEHYPVKGKFLCCVKGNDELIQKIMLNIERKVNA